MKPPGAFSGSSGASSAPAPPRPGVKAPSDFGSPETSAPAEKADPNAFEFREPEAKTVGSGYDAKKLKKLTPEEKARRKLK